MKALIVNTSDTEGGAARAALRLHQGLQQQQQVDTHLLVQMQRSDATNVVGGRAASGTMQAKAGLRLTLDQILLKRYRHRTGGKFSPQWLPDNLGAQIEALEPDVVNLHWLNNGFMQIETLAKLKRPLVWTLHDMWPFTGGCHYDQGCDRYQTHCHTCPQLGSTRSKDLSYRIWQRKVRAFKSLNLTVVTPSQWLKDCVQSSALLGQYPVECIPNGIDPERYRPMEKRIAREALGLPLDKRLILFGSLKATSDRRKGFNLLVAALQQVSETQSADTEVVIFGDREPQNPPKFGLKAHYLGSFSDDLALAFVYSAADIFVLPSVQENLANTVMEALACGVPCLAFDIGGMPDMIEHRKNGYLAKPFVVEDLAQGIRVILGESSVSNPTESAYSVHQQFSQQARASVLNKFTLAIQAQRYLSLFQAVIKR